MPLWMRTCNGDGIFLMSSSFRVPKRLHALMIAARTRTLSVKDEVNSAINKPSARIMRSQSKLACTSVNNFMSPPNFSRVAFNCSSSWCGVQCAVCSAQSQATALAFGKKCPNLLLTLNVVKTMSSVWPVTESYCRRWERCVLRSRARRCSLPEYTIGHAA